MKKFTLFLTVTSLAWMLTACQTDVPTPMVADANTGYYSNPNYPSTYALAPGQDIIGETHVTRVKQGETVSGIASRYDVGLQEVIDANPHINTKQLTIGEHVVIPSQYILPPKKYRDGIVINVAEMRIYYFSPDGQMVSTYPVALGREQWRTPVADTTVVKKEKDPSWHVPESIRKYTEETQGKTLPEVVPPGPDNPLGNYAIYLAKSGYLIHGTNAPSSIGHFISSGCVRMYNEDVAELFNKVQPGTPVHIIYYPAKAGWKDGKLYVESHPPIIDPTSDYSSHTVSVDKAINEAAAGKAIVVDTYQLDLTIENHNGNPTAVGILES